MCVQNLDDSRGLAIRITYRISLRSSSLWEPRHPLLKVVKLSMSVDQTPQKGATQCQRILCIQILVGSILVIVMGWPEGRW